MYEAKVRFLKSRLGSGAARRWPRLWRPAHVPASADVVRRYAPGKSFADIGCMWQTHGEHAFVAEAAGATRVVGVDIYRTEEFDRRHAEKGSSVEFVCGPVDDPAVREQVGVVDVLWCFGLLYHHPNPWQLLAWLRSMCGEILILESLTIPEVPGLAHSATFYPWQPERARRLWDTTSRGGAKTQLGISEPFRPERGYANNFWGLSPRCVGAVARTAGFEVEQVLPSPSGRLRHVFICRPVPETLQL